MPCRFFNHHEKFVRMDLQHVDSLPIESHPFPPFMPEGATVLFMGTFPPKPNRWSMAFYYPNPNNDFWRIMGLIFLNDKDALWLPAEKKFDEQAIRCLMSEHHIALSDTGHVIRRLKDNASDKFLEIIEPVPLASLLEQMPHCRFLATTGEKAADTLAAITDTAAPKMGQWCKTALQNPHRQLQISRLPSTSRAYPMKIEEKAKYYREFLHQAEVL